MNKEELIAKIKLFGFWVYPLIALLVFLLVSLIFLGTMGASSSDANLKREIELYGENCSAMPTYYEETFVDLGVDGYRQYTDEKAAYAWMESQLKDGETIIRFRQNLTKVEDADYFYETVVSYNSAIGKKVTTKILRYKIGEDGKLQDTTIFNTTDANLLQTKGVIDNKNMTSQMKGCKEDGKEVKETEKPSSTPSEESSAEPSAEPTESEK